MKRFASWVIVYMLFGSLSYGQAIFATLTGVVSDPSGAVVPNAKVRLRNESTGSLRDTVTNSDGYFSFASLAAGDFTYELTLEAQGFVTYKASGIALGGGEKRNINVTLKVGSTSETIEVKVQMSNFSAENQKGPIVASSVAKWGTKDFHGSGFFYARNYVLNANDALNNATQTARPENKYYYPGVTIGGPVLIPGTGFNKNRNKLFFFTGFEYFYQVLDTGLLRATVPTPGMLQGNFSPSEIAKIGPYAG